MVAAQVRHLAEQPLEALASGRIDFLPAHPVAA